MNYNEETIIGDEKISLSKEESKLVADFHKDRIAFAFLEDGSLACNIHDQREHRVYLKEDFGVTDELFEKLVRGYIKPGRIVFYQSSHFTKLEEDVMQYIDTIGVLAVQSFGSGKYEIWNGVAVGKPGEEWNPISIPYVLNLDLRFSKGRHSLYKTNLEGM